MKKQILVLLIIALVGGNVWAKDEKSFVPRLKLSGYVGAETIFDTRDMIAVGNGDILLYPKNELKDINGDDLNDNEALSMYGACSRIRLSSLPVALLGGTVSSFIEFDFAALAGAKMTTRLRHAVVKFSKGNNEITVGHTWHPMFVPSVAPGTRTVIGGAMFIAFSRNPQIRYSHRFSSEWKGALIVSSQSDSKSPGFEGASTEYMRKSVIPEFNAHLEYTPSANIVFGGVAGVKTLKPRLINKFGVKVDESITTYHAMAYAKFLTEKLQWKMQGFYVQNGYDLLMLGGYGVSKVELNNGNSIENFEYSPISTCSVWGELSTRRKSPFNYGVFFGYAKNLGSDDDLSEGFVRGSGIEKLYRIAPRVVFAKDKLNVSLEVNHTIAYFGEKKSDYTVKNSDSVNGTRVQFCVKYFF